MSSIDQEALRGVVEKVLADLGKLPSAPAAPAPSPAPAEEKKDCGCSCSGTGKGEHGVFGCLGMMACQDVCPKDLPLLEVYAYLRRRALAAALSESSARRKGGERARSRKGQA